MPVCRVTSILYAHYTYIRAIIIIIILDIIFITFIGMYKNVKSNDGLKLCVYSYLYATR